MSASAAARVIWLSDLHFEATGLVQGHDPRVRLEAAIDNINQHYSDADLCLITGDMVDTATAENYREVKRRLDRLAMPWGPMTGNHDGRALFLEHLPLPGEAMPGFPQYVVDLPQARLICLDSLWEGEDAGELCAARLDWLEARLAERNDMPALVFLHHPPMKLGLPMLDPDRLKDGEVLLEMLARYPQVQHICSGHVHRPVSGRVGHISFTGLRAVLYQAPPPVPAWDWDTFKPPEEAPEMGVITVDAGQITLRTEQFCEYATGGVR